MPLSLNFFRRKRGEKAPPLVVEQCWPTKKARLIGFRKKRTHQIMFGAVTAEDEITEPVLQSETVVDDVEVVLPSVELPSTQSLEVVLPTVVDDEITEQCLQLELPSTQSAEVQTEEVQTEEVQTEEVQTEEKVQNEEVRNERWLRGPSGVGKKTKSINKMYAVEPTSGKKVKKSSGRTKKTKKKA
jgi:hypothetical protein